MTREMLIKHWEVIQAFKEGKIVQHLREGDKWVDEENPSFGCNYNFRIKPEPKLVPFTFEDATNIVGKIVKGKPNTQGYQNVYVLILGADLDGVGLGGKEKLSYADLLDCCTFIDGTPCGKYKETKTT